MAYPLEINMCRKITTLSLCSLLMLFLFSSCLKTNTHKLGGPYQIVKVEIVDYDASGNKTVENYADTCGFIILYNQTNTGGAARISIKYPSKFLATNLNSTWELNEYNAEKLMIGPSTLSRDKSIIGAEKWSIFRSNADCSVYTRETFFMKTR